MHKDHVIDALEEILNKAKGYQLEPVKNKVKARAITVTSDPEEEEGEEDMGDTESPESLSAKLMGSEGEGEEEGEDDDLKDKLMELLAK